MLRALIVSAALLLPLPSIVWSKEALSIVVDPWAPFGGQDLPNGGISLDVISTVLERAGYDIETNIVPWERAIDGVKTDSYDVIGNIFFLPDLEEFLTYSQPFYESEVRFVQRQGAGHSYTDLDSLRPYSIAVGAGYFYEENFDRADFLNKTTVTTVIQGVRMVANGRVDLTLDSVDVINYVIAKEEPELAGQVEVLPNRLTTQAIHMAVRDSHPDKDKIISDFNRILSEMREDGSLDELLAKHRY